MFIASVAVASCRESAAPAINNGRPSFAGAEERVRRKAILKPLRVELRREDGSLDDASGIDVALRVLPTDGMTGSPVYGTVTRATSSGVAIFDDIHIEAAGVAFLVAMARGLSDTLTVTVLPAVVPIDSTVLYRTLGGPSYEPMGWSFQIMSSTAAVPDIVAGDVLVGNQDGGYVGKVISWTVSGNTASGVINSYVGLEAVYDNETVTFAFSDATYRAAAGASVTGNRFFVRHATLVRTATRSIEVESLTVRVLPKLEFAATYGINALRTLDVRMPVDVAVSGKVRLFATQPGGVSGSVSIGEIDMPIAIPVAGIPLSGSLRMPISLSWQESAAGAAFVTTSLRDSLSATVSHQWPPASNSTGSLTARSSLQTREIEGTTKLDLTLLVRGEVRLLRSNLAQLNARLTMDNEWLMSPASLQVTTRCKPAIRFSSSGILLPFSNSSVIYTPPPVNLSPAEVMSCIGTASGTAAPYARLQLFTTSDGSLAASPATDSVDVPLSESDVAVSAAYEPGQPTGWLTTETRANGVNGRVIFKATPGELPAASYRASADIRSVSNPAGTARNVVVHFSVRRGFTALSSRDGTCGLTSGGEVYCWGFQQASGFSSTTPQRVPGDHRFLSIAAGNAFACGVDDRGAAYCWGLALGRFGSLRTPNVDPVRVDSPVQFTSIAAGEDHACALAVTGEAYCWGANHKGQLGNSTLVESVHAVRVSTGERFTQLSAGTSLTCGLTASGSAFCWGINDFGALGQGDGGAPSLVPVKVSKGPYAQLSTGHLTTCATTPASKIYCWGGGFGGPLAIESIGVAGSVSTSGRHQCAISGQTTVCWGRNVDGELGNGGQSELAGVTEVAAARPFKSIHTGWNFTCGLVAGGEAYCWGSNFDGDLGDGSSRTSALAPVRVIHP